MSVLEVTDEHVKALDDKQLRDLVVRLCRAELRRLGLPLHALTDGGHQNAADGGVDVRIELPHSADAAPGMDFIRRKHTVFQCKAEDMPPKDIAKEMKPGGVLRPVIAELMRQRGAYIIVSSVGTAADLRLGERRQAMRDCVAGLAGEQDLLLDFYDRKRLARWACQYAGVAAWVRERVGQPIDGWRAHGEWAAPRSGHMPYEADAHPRLWTGEADQQTPRPIADGLRALRDRLVRERGVARLVGLSGTGKTRLAQALFEEDIDPDGALDPALALYADLAGEGRDRLAFLTRLQSDGLRAIVVLDNCPPDQHRRFADLCGGEGSRLSLLTLNLDVQDDQPEDTQVFKLEAASDDVTARVIRQESRSAPLGSAACRRIAELAGGNARLALALARSVPAGSLAKLRDADLFDRLFHQGRRRDDALLRSARACALVYSFNSGSNGDTSELAVLAGWAGTDAGTLYGHVAELQRRGLAQQRDVWRAVLPQALAVHLARKALEDLLPQTLELSLQQAPPRLMRSFTRQLGLLHDSPQAQLLVKKWLVPAGQPCDLSACNAEQLTWFSNLAPVDPQRSLEALERLAPTHWPDDSFELRKCCVALAYEDTQFPKAVRLLMTRFSPQFVATELKRLFQMKWSGTQARLLTRLRTVQDLLYPPDDSAQNPCFTAVSGMLCTESFDRNGHDDHAFGARVRDRGWWPQCPAESDEWYVSVLGWIGRQAQGPLRSRLQLVLANALPGLCKRVGRPAIAQALEACVIKLIVGSASGMACWADVNASLHRARRNISPTTDPETTLHTHNCLQALERLEALLQPSHWIDEVRLHAVTVSWHINKVMNDPQDGESTEARRDRLEAMSREYGRTLAERPSDIDTLLPELVAYQASFHAENLGEGLGQACKSAVHCQQLWDQLVTVFSAAAQDDRDIALLRGFLKGAAVEHMPLAQQFLKHSATDTVLGRHQLLLASALPIDAQGNLTPIHYHFKYCCDSNQITTTSPADLVTLLHLLTKQDVAAQDPSGFVVAIGMLYQRIFFDAELPNGPSAEILQCGLELLAHPKFDNKILPLAAVTESWDIVDLIARTCLKNQGHAGTTTRALACRLAEKIKLDLAQSDFPLSVFYLPALLATHPILTLDVLLGDASVPLSHLINFNLCLADEIPASMLIAWVHCDPAVRAPRVAALCSYEQTHPSGPSTWTPLAQDLINACPDRLPVLQQFADRLVPQSRSGSLAVIVEQRRALFSPYLTDTEAPVAAWAREFDAIAQRKIERLRQQDQQLEQEAQRFE